MKNGNKYTTVLILLILILGGALNSPVIAGGSLDRNEALLDDIEKLRESVSLPDQNQDDVLEETTPSKGIELSVNQKTYLNIKHYRPKTYTEYNLRSPYTGWTTGWMRDYEEAKAKIRVYHEVKRVSNSWYKQTREITEDELIGDYYKDEDLLLSNYVNWTANTLSGRYSLFHLKDDQGENKASSGSVVIPFDGWTYIRIGTGTTAPDFDDYQLENETHSVSIHDWFYESSGTSYNISATIFITFSGSYAITEAGLCIYHEDFSDEVYLTRDTFTAQNVVADDTLAVTVTLGFSGNVCRNYGYLLSTLFYGDVDQEKYDPLMTDGTTINWYNDAHYWRSSPQIKLGTDSTAFALDDYKVVTEVLTDTIDLDAMVIYDKSGNDVNITVIGYYPVDASYSIYEIGLYTYLDTSGEDGSYAFMILREVLDSPWSVSGGDNIAVYLTWIIDQP